MSADVEVEIRNPTGLHARPAATFVKAAARAVSTVTVANVTTASPPANAKSITAVLGIGAAVGHRIRIVAEGADAAETVETLRDLVERGLGEALEA